MCRLAAHAGPPVPLSSLLYDPPRSLEVLAYDPREQLSGHVNVDGTAVTWFEPDDPVPLQYRTAATPWGDPNLPALSRRLRSHLWLAAVRSATPGIPLGTAFAHPFVAGNLAGTHNGWISDFRTRVARPLMAQLSDEAFAWLPGMSDAAVLFALAWDAHRAGADACTAARTAVDRTAAVCRSVGASATLTLVLADAEGIAAVNAAEGRQANSLYLSPLQSAASPTGATPTGGEGGALLASEPLDPALTWLPVPPDHHAVATPTRWEISR